MGNLIGDAGTAVTNSIWALLPAAQPTADPDGCEYPPDSDGCEYPPDSDGCEYPDGCPAVPATPADPTADPGLRLELQRVLLHAPSVGGIRAEPKSLRAMAALSARTAAAARQAAAATAAHAAAPQAAAAWRLRLRVLGIMAGQLFGDDHAAVRIAAACGV